MTSKLTVNESEDAATLAAREERTFDSEVEVSADLDSLAATDVARALLGNILCVSNRSAVKISAEVSADLDLSLMSPDSESGPKHDFDKFKTGKYWHWH